MARLVALIAVVALAATPAAAVAASSGELIPKTQQAPAPPPVPAQTQAPAQTPTQSTGSDGGVSNSQLGLMALGAAVLIGGIWVVIMRDARRAVPESRRQRIARGDDEPRSNRTRAKRRKLSPAERRRRKRSRAG